VTQTKLRVALSDPVFCLEDNASAPCNSGATVIRADAERWENWRQTVSAKCREMSEWHSNYLATISIHSSDIIIITIIFIFNLDSIRSMSRSL